ncbi:MAG: F0F1 ATP synthase subunit B [Acidimicrobiales bacterium]
MNLLSVLATEEATKPPNPVIPDVNEIVWAAIFFCVLWALMKYVLLPPITRAMEARAGTIQGDRDAADEATAALGSTRRDYEAALTDARNEANTIIAAARSSADERRGAMQAEADAEIAELRRSAQAEIDQARAEALGGMRGDIASLAVGAAGVVLGRTLDPAAQQSVIDQALAGD